MISFRVGFLFAFSLLPKPSDKKEKRGKKDKKGKKEKKGKKSKDKKSKKSKSSKKELIKKELPPKPDYVLQVGNPIGYLHAEYELLPKRMKQNFDIVCWNGVAKIFTEEETLIYRVKVSDDKVWVPVFLEHSCHTLETEELINLHSHVIDFRISTNKNKLSPKAKSENTKEFFIRQEDVGTDCFTSAYNENPNVQEESSSSLRLFMEEIITDCIYKPGSRHKIEIVMRLKFKDSTHMHWMEKIINNSCCDFFFREYLPLQQKPMTCEEIKALDEKQNKPTKAPPVKNKKKGKKSKKGKKKSKSSKKSSKSGKKDKKPKSSTELIIKVNGEVFFTDPVLAMYDLKIPNDLLTNGFVFLSVDRLMTRQQKYSMNPLIVKVDKIDDLNDELLRKHKFKSIFVRYNIPYIAQAKTMERDLDQKIRFCESRAHFTDTVPDMKFIEFMQSQRFFVEICGRREENAETDIEPRVFGTEINDKNLSRRFTAMETLFKVKRIRETNLAQEEVLAVVSYDLTPLLIPTWRVSSNEACHSPDNIQYQKAKCTPFTVNNPHVTTHNLNIKTLFMDKSRSPLTEVGLIEFGTTLKMEFSFAAPICMMTQSVVAKAQYYNRLFMIIYNVDLAINIFHALLFVNRNVIKDIIVPNKLHEIDPALVEGDAYVTGFIIDNGNRYAFYLECNIKSFIKPIWEKVMNVSPKEAKVYFNYNTVFEQRQYSHFVKLGGFCVITLQKALRDILAMEKFYLVGYVPLPCWQAAKKLDLLFRCTTLKDMNQFNLFPSVEELISFDMEFGVAMRGDNAILKSEEGLPISGLHSVPNAPPHVSTMFVASSATW